MKFKRVPEYPKRKTFKKTLESRKRFKSNELVISNKQRSILKEAYLMDEPNLSLYERYLKIKQKELEKE